MQEGIDVEQSWWQQVFQQKMFLFVYRSQNKPVRVGCFCTLVLQGLVKLVSKPEFKGL